MSKFLDSTGVAYLMGLVKTLVSNRTPSTAEVQNAGGVTKVKVGTTGYDPTSGVVELPAYPTTLPASDVSEWAKANSKPSYTANEVGAIPSTEKGAANGVASLDENGQVPASQLPSYVDDVIELLNLTDTAPSTCAKGDKYYNTSSKKIFTATSANTWGSTGKDPESGKIYTNLSNSKTYRWGGTEMAVISDTIAIGTTAGTAYDGASGAALASKLSGIEEGAQAHKAPTAAEVKSALGTGSGTTKFLREDGTWVAPPSYSNATQSADGLMSSTDKTKLDGIASGAQAHIAPTTAEVQSAGGVTKVTVGTTDYSPSSGVVTLPAYPTTLPASDVSSWAKASSKPSYTASEVGAVATSDALSTSEIDTLWAAASAS